MTALSLRPITLRQAKAFVGEHHRHNPSMVGWKFGIGVEDEQGALRGVVVVGRPVARRLDNGTTAEVTRCCTDGTPNACSLLYAAAWRAARAMGYRRLITYTNETEPGTSLKATGFRQLHSIAGRSWNCPSRPREDRHEILGRTLWELTDPRARGGASFAAPSDRP